MYGSKDRLVIFVVDGTLIDSFHAVERAFAFHGMDIGDLHDFQWRKKLHKYLGGRREFPKNLHRQLGKEIRMRLKATHTEPAPWTLVDFNVQRRGRLKLIRHLLDAVADHEVPDAPIDFPPLGHEPLKERFKGPLRPL